MKSGGKKIADKREKEKEIVRLMILLYCRKKHGAKRGLCAECERLAEYAERHTDRYPFMETKTFCSNCRAHCYTPDMREKIKTVMRFSGPRMLLHHPATAVWHLVCSLKEKRRFAKEDGK